MQLRSLFKIFFLVIFIGCASKTDSIEDYMENHQDIAGRIVVFPTQLTNYNLFPLPNGFFENEKKIICLGNMDCNTCVLMLKEIENFKSDHPEIKVGYIASGPDFEYFKYQTDKNNFTFPIFHDPNALFLNVNNLQNYNRSVFLISENNQILLVGSPFNNSIIKDFYLKMLSK